MEKFLNSLLVGAVLLIGALTAELAEYKREVATVKFMYQRSKAAVAYNSAEASLHKTNVESLQKRVSDMETKIKTIVEHFPILSPYFITGRYGDVRETHIHQGLDLAVPQGTSIYSPIAGRCIPSWDDNGGWIATVYNEKVSHRFMHCRYRPISGEVEAGSIIAFSGNTGKSQGPHVHWEIFIGEARVDPEDYLKLLKQI